MREMVSIVEVLNYYTSDVPIITAFSRNRTCSNWAQMTPGVYYLRLRHGYDTTVTNSGYKPLLCCKTLVSEDVPVQTLVA